MAQLDFWYEFASAYSYLSAMRIAEAAESEGVALRWRPFLLGPIFVAQGWTTSPFTLYPAKGRYMVQDMKRLSAARGLKFALPDPFPQNGLLAARLAMIGAVEGWAPDFTRAVYVAEFDQARNISERHIMTEILVELGLDAPVTLERAEMPENKARLKEQTEEAAARGIFGAPSFTVGGELFWGDDRMQDALAHARSA